MINSLLNRKKPNTKIGKLILDGDTDNSVANATCNVVFRKAILLSTDPSSGKNSVALSN